MSTTTITIPDFDFSGFYYPEILEALIQYKRANVPELTDESDVEPTIQFLRAFACVGHLSNVLVDLVANESTLPTAELVETVRNMLRLIDYELKSATPSQTDLVYELSKTFTTTTEVVSANARAATKREGDSAPVYFEALESLSIARTDRHQFVYAEEDGTFTDFTAEANSQTTPADDWEPLLTPDVKDAIYWGHSGVMWDKISIHMSTYASGALYGVWEFYDGDWAKTKPTSVTDLGPNLQFDLTSLLGVNNRKGTIVRVQLNETAVYEEIESVWLGGKNVITTTGLLGQTTPSTDVDEYSVGSDWTELGDTDDSSNFSIDGDFEFVLPQTLERDWVKTTINGSEAYWIRWRVVYASGTIVNPVFQYTQMDQGKLYVWRLGTQGRTVIQDPLGSSTGLDDQRFSTSKDNFIWNSETVEVEGEEWERVDNFLDSTSTSKHYRVLLGENDKATIVFGAAGKGKIPPIGVGNISITYRYNAEADGNVGADTVSVDKTGLTYISRIWNPRQATGWTEAQGASEESLEQAKIAGPSSLRTKEVALGPDDVAELAIAWTDDAGASPFSRAIAIEEGLGPKTIELVLVASGGGLASAAQLEAIEQWFNGDKYVVPKITKHLVANQEVGAVNYTQKVIDIEATVYGKTTVAAVEAKLNQKIHPEAKKDSDATEFEWESGKKVSTSRINSIIFSTDSTITDVDIATPASDIILQLRELPVLGTVNVTILDPL